MVKISLYDFKELNKRMGIISAFAVARYDSVYAIGFYPKFGVVIMDLVNKKVYDAGGSDPDASGDDHKALEIKVGKSKVVMKLIYDVTVNNSEYVRVSEVEIDLSEKKAYLTKIVDNQINGWVKGFSPGNAVTMDTRTIITNDSKNNVIVVDVYSGDVKKSVATNLETPYWVRPCYKMVLRNDFVLMMGRHYAGDPQRKIELFSGKIETITIQYVNAGGSPRPHSGVSFIAGRDTIIPVTWGGVIGTKNDILLLDNDLNVIGAIDVGPMSPSSNAYTACSGNAILARMTTGEYFGYAWVVSQESTNIYNIPNKARMNVFKISKPSNNKVSPTVLSKYDLNDIFDYWFNFPRPDSSDFKCRPIIDVVNAKIYLVGSGYIVQNGLKPRTRLFVIDISDIIDDVEEWTCDAIFVSVD